MADRVFRDIRDALAERDFNYDMFEECVCDLLRDAFPGIVPIRGGADAGMDGAIPTGDAAPIPVVITTAENVTGNLGRNLDRYLDEGGRQRKVVLATSRELTPRNRRNLDDKAQDKGFILTQIFERRDIARLLYHRPEWCRELLGLTGQPAALTEVPPTRRPLLPIDLIGRHADLDWLKAVDEDSLLVGEPGSGKTFLLNKLVEEGLALFLASTDETAIANDLRRSEPALVIVDDAHDDLWRIDLLRRLRREVHAGCAIVATTWPWSRHQDDVLEALGGLPRSRAHTLGPLTRDEIVSVVKQVGIHDPNELIRAIVDQSGNKPGLAVTLALLCLQGEVLTVVRGEALSRNLLSIFRSQIGPEATSILACLAAGGEAGMAYERVATHLGLSLSDLREAVTALASGGVLTPRVQGVLAVEPLALRAALVRDEVLGGPAPLDRRRLMDMAEDRSSAVDALVAGVAFGAPISRAELERLVLDHGSKKAWQTLAALDGDGAARAKVNYRGPVLDIAGPALHSSPKLAIRWLLEESEKSDGAKERVFEVLGWWVGDTDQSQSTLIERRRNLAGQAVAHLNRGGSSRTFWDAVRRALSVLVESSRRDPGAGRTVTWSHGHLTGYGITEIVKLWQEVRQTALRTEGLAWKELQDLLHEWLKPGHRVPNLFPPEEDREALVALSKEVLVDLAPHFEGQPGAISEIRSLGSTLDLDLRFALDPDFEALYPRDILFFEASDEEMDELHEAVRELASMWRLRTPSEVANRLAFYDAQAKAVDRPGLRLAPELAAGISSRVERSEDWIQAFVEAAVRPDLLAPFLDRLLGDLGSGWQEVAEDLLASDRYQRTAAQKILALDSPPAQLQERSLEVAEQHPDLVQDLCRNDDLPEEVVWRLLNSPKAEASLAAVVGLWWPPRHEIPAALRKSWRSAVLRAPSSEVGYGELVSSRNQEYWLGRILASDPELALEWLERRFRERQGQAVLLSSRGAFRKAIDVLDPQRRCELLERASPDWIPRGLITLLVSRDADLYRRLLARRDLADHHLVPLQGEPDEAWWDLAKLAVASGYASAEVADAALYSSWVICTTGHGIDRWKRYEEAFAEEEGSTDPVIREIAGAGLRIAREGLRRAEEKARQRAIEGYR